MVIAGRQDRLRAVIAVAIVASLSSTGHAQGSGGIALDHYRAAETSLDGFAVRRPGDLGWLSAGAQVHFDYGLRPLVVREDPADPMSVSGTLVEHLLAGRVGGFVGLIDRLVFFASLPVVFVMEGDAIARLPNADGAGIGDVQLGTRVRLVGEDNDVGAVAIQLAGTVPTAEAARTEQNFSGEQSVSFTPEAIGELRFNPVHITGNVGFRVRDRADLQNLPVSFELTWAAGVGVTLLEELLEIRAEGYGSVGLEEPRRRFAPAEAILGVRVHPFHGFVVGLAGGFGIGRGYGTPVFRGVLSVGYSAPIDVGGSRGGESELTDPPSDETDLAEPSVGEALRPSGIPEGDRDIPAPERETSAPPAPSRSVSNGTSVSSSPEASAVARPDYAAIDRDGDRVMDARDRCPIDYEDYDEIQDNDGCPELDADQDEVLDIDDQCPLTPGDVLTGRCAGCPRLACVSAASGQITITERVEFETGEAVLLERSDPVLNAVLAILQSNDQLLRVRIEGHTDDRGDDPDNLDLSQRRAQTVVRWMLEHGVAAVRLVGFGCGEAHPVSPNRTRRGRQENRRVEFLIVDPPSGQTLHEGCQPADQD